MIMVWHTVDFLVHRSSVTASLFLPEGSLLLDVDVADCPPLGPDQTTAQLRVLVAESEADKKVGYPLRMVQIGSGRSITMGRVPDPSHNAGDPLPRSPYRSAYLGWVSYKIQPNTFGSGPDTVDWAIFR